MSTTIDLSKLTASLKKMNAKALAAKYESAFGHAPADSLKAADLRQAILDRAANPEPVIVRDEEPAHEDAPPIEEIASPIVETEQPAVLADEFAPAPAAEAEEPAEADEPAELIIERDDAGGAPPIEHLDQAAAAPAKRVKKPSVVDGLRSTAREKIEALCGPEFLAGLVEDAKRPDGLPKLEVLEDMEVEAGKRDAWRDAMVALIRLDQEVSKPRAKTGKGKDAEEKSPRDPSTMKTVGGDAALAQLKDGDTLTHTFKDGREPVVAKVHRASDGKLSFTCHKGKTWDSLYKLANAYNGQSWKVDAYLFFGLRTWKKAEGEGAAKPRRGFDVADIRAELGKAEEIANWIGDAGLGAEDEEERFLKAVLAKKAEVKAASNVFARLLRIIDAQEEKAAAPTATTTPAPTTEPAAQ